MPEVGVELSLEGKTLHELEQMRDVLIRKAAGSYENLSTEDLHVMAACTSAMRRKSAGPPKAPKEKKTKSPKSDADLLDML